MTRRTVVLAVLLVACSSPKQSPAPEPGSAALVALPPVAPLVPGAVVTWRPLDRSTPFLAARIHGDRSTPCAVSRDGRVACWGVLGSDDDGPVELRHGTGTPHELAGIADVTDVVGSWFWLCVAQRTGPGGCFALQGGLDRAAPAFPSPPVELVHNDNATCARLRDGRVACTDIDAKVTVIANIAGATKLACDMRGCCAVVAKGALACFGDVESLAIHSPNKAVAPKLALPPAIDVQFDYDGGCVRTAAGAAECWGTAKPRSRPSGVRAIVEREGTCVVVEPDGTLDCEHAYATPITHVVDAIDNCLVRDDGSVSCSGTNEHGELGDGHALFSAAPVRVSVDGVKELRVAHTEACVVRSNDHVWCWGRGPLQDVGIGSRLAVGQYHASCRFGSGLTVWCSTAYNDEWQTEREPIAGSNAPTEIRALAIDRVSNVCAIDAAGAIRCQFSTGETDQTTSWIPLAAAKRATDIEPLGTGFCAALEDGTVGCYTDHRWDQDQRSADPVTRAALAPVPGLTGVTRLATGSGSACAVAAEGRVWCWFEDNVRVKELPSLRGATYIAANDHHMCAVLHGEVWCWGEGRYGQLGDGKLTDRRNESSVPVKAKLPARAIAVGVGRVSTCALDDQHRVWCWGGDGEGQLAQGRTLYVREPRPVVGLGPSDRRPGLPP